MFKFTKTDRDGQIVHQHEVEDVSWVEVTELFQQFLSGCGYHFKEGFDMAEILEEAHWEKMAEHKKSVNAKLPFGLGDF